MAPFHPRHQSLTNKFRDEYIGIDLGPKLNALYWKLSVKEN